MYQMIELAEEIEKRGGTPRIRSSTSTCIWTCLRIGSRDRIEELSEAAACSPEKYLVPGSRMLEALKERGLKMYLASGTDDVYMQRRSQTCSAVTRYFDGGVFGALDDYKSFSKAILIQRIIGSAGIQRRRVSWLRRRLCGDREREAGRRRRGRCGDRRAGVRRKSTSGSGSAWSASAPTSSFRTSSATANCSPYLFPE